MKTAILLVDDELGILRALQRLLRRHNYQVTIESDARSALETLKREKFEVVISDYRMPGINGIQFLSEVRNQYPGITRLMLSGAADRKAVLASINEAEIFRFLTKPWDEEEIVEAVAAAVDRRNLNEEINAALHEHRIEKDGEYRRMRIAEQLEQESPGITEVNWSDNDTIIIEDG